MTLHRLSAVEAPLINFERIYQFWVLPDLQKPLLNSPVMLPMRGKPIRKNSPFTYSYLRNNWGTETYGGTFLA